MICFCLPHRVWRWFKAIMASSVILFCLLVSWYIITHYDLLPPRLGPTPSWRGIMPGKTLLHDGFDQIEDKYEVEYRNGYWTYRYTNAPFVGWRILELWAQDRAEGRVIVGIYLSGPRPTPLQQANTIIDKRCVTELVEQYGRPDKVTWSAFRFRRALMWARDGVMVEAGAHFNQPGFDLNNACIGEMLLFEPMGLKKLLRTSPDWPWANSSIWSWNNMYTGHSPDNVAENPYNWDNLLP